MVAVSKLLISDPQVPDRYCNKQHARTQMVCLIGTRPGAFYRKYFCEHCHSVYEENFTGNPD